MQSAQTELVRQIVLASQGHGAPAVDYAVDYAGVVVDRALIAALKQEVSHCIRVDLQRAARLAETTRRLAQQTDDPLAHALGLRAHALALHVNGHYAEAIELCDEALAVYRANGDFTEAARTVRTMLDALMYLGEYERALAVADEARGWLAGGVDEILLAQLETNVGNVHHRLDQYAEALACYERAKIIFTQAHGAQDIIISAINCANIHSNLDDFQQAQTEYQSALELARTEKLDVFAAQAQYSLGYLHFLKGEYHPAMRVLHDAQTEFSRQGDERHTALCQLDLTEIYLQLHVLDEAAQLAVAARQRFHALGIRYEAAKARAWYGLARLQQGELDEAEQALLEAQAEFQTEGNEVWLGLLELYLAELHLQRAEPAQAFTLAVSAQTLFQRLGLAGKVGYAQLIAAKAAWRDGAEDNALAAGELVLSVSGELEAPWLRQQAHELLGDIHLARGAGDRAYEHFTAAIQDIEQIRGGIRVDEFRSAFFRDRLRVYEKLIRLCLAETDADKQAEAFYYLESRKARTLVDLLINELDVAPNPSLSPVGSEQAELFERWQQLRSELHWFYSKANLNEVNGKSRQAGAQQQLRSEIQQRERALAEVARQAQLQDPAFRWLRNVAGITADELREVLAADESLIEYYFDGEQLAIFVIDRAGLRTARSPITRQQLRAAIQRLRFQLEKFQYGPAYATAHQDKLQAGADACLRELYDALFAPIADVVQGRKLIFVPFDLLHNVPFQALFDGQQYLLEKHEIAFAPSARLYALCARRPWRKRGRALVFGAADAVAPKITEEIEAIQALFPDARCYQGEAANAQALTAALPASDIVHIASHAVFRQDNPMFSAFRLADSWLNFYDVSTLRLPGALVTLSGCSTGTSGIYAGDEFLGLVRGFLTAGAAAMVVSLWAVNDPATAKLMTAFYGYLQDNLPPRTALRQAALQIKDEYKHPYYWAPFVYIGHTPNTDSSFGVAAPDGFERARGVIE